MECNKDDAVKAMEIAERKFNAKDIAGAKKFALKAQNLYPGLEGIAQMLVTLDVYASYENQIVGEADWYGVLGVSPQADEDSVRKQYRKLAFTLHPDKNNSIGAEGAFKLVSQAWSLLSDKSRRAAYDAKRNAQAKRPYGIFNPSGANGVYNFPKTTSSSAKLNKNKNVSRSNGSSTSGLSSQNTFWTVCHRCRMQYEYLRTYLNQNLLCPSCRQPFLATEQAAPESKSSMVNFGQRPQNSHQDPRPKGNPKGDFQWVPFSGASGGSSVAQAANVVQQTYEKVRRVREEAQAAKKHDKAMKRKNYVENMAGCIEKKRRVDDNIGSHQTDIQNILICKARTEICKILNGCRSVNPMDIGKAKATEEIHGLEKSKGTIVTNSDMHDVELTEVKVSLPVPNSDFHNFDQYRTERDFEEGQVWAFYDNVDGMPRHYFMIRRVKSRDPFKLRVTWLNSETNAALGLASWFSCGFKKTCGEFRVGRHETFDGLNCFSHKVRWTKSSCGAICIFPRKGDVWALYRNWCPKWDESTGDDLILKYDMVEVLEDYDENSGVLVIPLVKVAGFKALFHPHLDPEQVRRIPKGEIDRFSHQVPSHLISGQEAFYVPKSCRELDPAALPVDFIQVIGDAQEAIVVNKATMQGNVTFDDHAKPINIVTKTEKTKEEVA